jgi:hypothetical protein
LDAVELINQPVDGDKQKLKEFVDSVTTAFELVNPTKHDLFLKFVKIKITRVAKSKLLVRDLKAVWHDVKQILEKNYRVRRTFNYYVGLMFSSRQGANESIASWSSRINTMQSELKEAAYTICEDEEVIHVMGLINHLAKACFVQRLSNKRIQTIVQSKGETALLSTCIAALEEELTILSAREKGFSVQKGYLKIFKGPARVSVQANNGGSSREQVLRESGEIEMG